MSFNAFGKPSETVDFGGEVDYAAYEWFKDPPPRPEPQTPLQQPGQTYAPPPSVIEKNEMCQFALEAAPNVLFGRYKQYGQLGVLAWCSEFGEMIDELKRLGIAGDMFVATRDTALKACQEILRLQLEIKMQIIVIHLSSQVARLRRFLDADHVWEDYPETRFPLDPNAFPL
ncbi:hypothetical protein BC834DRAFT_815691 [Gloeopeniophorella convolvens]|nr:hypothetical protein BC834DRAFT_815691 [Gloeopeniophorella convolvens]